MEDFFLQSEHEVSYGPIVLLPFQFLDDLARFTFNPIDAQYGNNMLENLAEVKLLDYNLLKCSVVVLGTKKSRESLEEDFLEKNPTLYGQKVKIESQESYLGDQIGFSVADSVSLTIKKRLGLVKKSIFEIKSVVEDCRSQMVGGIQTGVLLWESCLIPFLLYNSSTWMEIRTSALEILSKLQTIP